MKYEPLVWQQGDEADETLTLIERRGVEVALEHLLSRVGDEPSGDLYDEIPEYGPNGTCHTVDFPDRGLVMQYNGTWLGLTALYRVVPD